VRLVQRQHVREVVERIAHRHAGAGQLERPVDDALLGRVFEGVSRMYCVLRDTCAAYWYRWSGQPRAAFISSPCSPNAGPHPARVLAEELIEERVQPDVVARPRGRHARDPHGSPRRAGAPAVPTPEAAIQDVIDLVETEAQRTRQLRIEDQQLGDPARLDGVAIGVAVGLERGLTERSTADRL
jgi:hypothetical protein